MFKIRENNIRNRQAAEKMNAPKKEKKYNMNMIEEKRKDEIN